MIIYLFMIIYFYDYIFYDYIILNEEMKDGFRREWRYSRVG